MGGVPLQGSALPGGSVGGGLFGAPKTGMGLPQGGSLFGASSGAGLFGCSQPVQCGGAFAPANSTGSSLFGSPPTPALAEPPTPAILLSSSEHMRASGHLETPLKAIRRGFAAVRNLASNGSQTMLSPVASAQNQDPLVSSLVDSILPAQLHCGAIHRGFTCDVTGLSPIVGPRLKSTSSLDHDLTLEARRVGGERYLALAIAGSGGYRVIQSPTSAMRLALEVIFSWWLLLWPERGDLFRTRVNLEDVSETQLIRAIANLPQA